MSTPRPLAASRTQDSSDSAGLPVTTSIVTPATKHMSTRSAAQPKGLTLKTTLRVAMRAFSWLGLCVVAVNLVWFVAPILGSPDIYRPLFAIVIVITCSAAYRQMRGE
jgi:hypothetical protein